MNLTKRILTLCIALLPLAAFAAEPAVTWKPHTFTAANGMKVETQLGELRVPENRTKAGSRTIALRFVRFPSTSSKPGPPIVYLAGGPGGSGTDALMGVRFALVQALREHGDVIAWDQRGTGQSEPNLLCNEPFPSDPTQPADRVKYGQALAGAIRKCADRFAAQGIDLAGYNTRESAADLEALRIGLGAEKLILWGISYGSHLSITALKMFPRSIDRVILAGIEASDDTYKLPTQQQELMVEIARLVARDPATKNDMPDLLGSIDKLLRDLERNPRRIPLVHPMNGQQVELVVGKGDLQAVIAQMLFGPDSFATIADLVGRVERGDWTALGLAAGQLRLAGRVPSLMSVAMDCASGITSARREQIAQEASRTVLADVINAPFPEVCSAVNVPDLGDEFRAPLRSKVPALLISGTLDGRTRPSQAEALRKGMPNAVHLVIEGAGHSDPLFLSSPKILETMQEFLRGKKLRDRRITVTNPVTFVPVRKPAAVSADALAKFAGEYRVTPTSTRRVVQAGTVLYSVRDTGQPMAIRMSSPTEFFYESSALAGRFEVDADGKVVAMTVIGPDGKPLRAHRVQ